VKNNEVIKAIISDENQYGWQSIIVTDAIPLRFSLEKSEDKAFGNTSNIKNA